MVAVVDSSGIMNSMFASVAVWNGPAAVCHHVPGVFLTLAYGKTLLCSSEQLAPLSRSDLILSLAPRIVIKIYGTAACLLLCLFCG